MGNSQVLKFINGICMLFVENDDKVFDGERVRSIQCTNSGATFQGSHDVLDDLHD